MTTNFIQKITVFALFLLQVNTSAAQQLPGEYANAWIDSTLVYSKISISKSGIYEISVQELSASLPGLIGSVPANLNLFYRGKSIAFEVQAAGNVLAPTDKIIFYGQANDGTLERQLYRPESSQPHPFSSLFTKTSVYYLCIDSKNPLKQRIIFETETNPTGGINVVKQNFQDQQIFDSDFSYNSTVGPIPIVQQSYFEVGEAYTGKMLRANIENKFVLPIDEAVSKKGTVEVLLNGRGNEIRKIRMQVADRDTTIVLAEFTHRLIKIPVNFSASTAKALDLTVSSKEDRYSVSLLRITYDRKIDNSASTAHIITDAKSKGVLTLNQVTAGFQPVIYNITDVYNIKKAKFDNNETGKYTYFINPTNFDKANTYFYTKSTLKQDEISSFNPKEIKLNNEANYLIVSHKQLLESAKEYSKFRESDEGEAFKVELVYIDQLYDHFNYGIKSPLAIKNYLTYKFYESTPSNLLLLGKAFSAHTGTNGPTDLVPSLGYPASDLLLSSGIISPIDVYGISTGRIPALTNKEVTDYITKLKRNLALPNQVQRKNVFHFSGGKNKSEINHFGNIMDAIAKVATSSDFELNLKSARKTEAVEVQNLNFTADLNEGQGLVSFFGHSSYNVIDFNIGYVTNPELGYKNNRSPVLFFNGCAFNNYFREIKTMSLDWILGSPDLGAVGIIGQSYYGYEGALTKHGTVLYQTIFNSDEEPTVGEALRITSERIANEPNFQYLDVLNNSQTLLLGDPAVRFFGFKKPDLFIDSSSIKSTFLGAERKILFKVLNSGKKAQKDKISIKILQEGLPESIVKIISIPAPKLSQDVEVTIPNISFLSKLSVTIDNDNFIPEENEANNYYEFKEGQTIKSKDQDAPFVSAKLDKQDPFELMVVSNKPVLELTVKDNNPVFKKGKDNNTIYGFFKKCDDCAYEKLDVSKIVVKKTIIDSATVIYNLELGEYKVGEHFLLFYVADSSKNIDFANPVKISFQIINEGTPEVKMAVYPNPSDKCVTFRLNDFGSNVAGEARISIAYFNGAKIADWTEKLVPGKTRINYCFNSPGVYVYKLKTSATNNQTFTGKILIAD